MLYLIIVQVILLDLITVWGIKRTFPVFFPRRRQGIYRAFIIQAAISVALLLCGIFLNDHISDYRIIAWYYCFFGCIVTLYLPKSVYAIFLMVDWIIPEIRKRRGMFQEKPNHIAAKCGFWTSILFVFLVVWGIFFGRFNCTVDHVELSFDRLPPSFDGYKIVQISDVHAGSFARSFDYFQKATDMINGLEPDLIVFTGDMVNNFAEETVPLIPVFSQLNARDGKYAVLGNHDYGGYYKWKHPADSVVNHQALIGNVEQMGFVWLNNQAVVITRNDSGRIVLIGTENWGKEKKRPKRGNIDAAMETAHDIPFKLLLSHDPWFWIEKIKGKTDVTLTLSGHTHGMQMGVKIGKKRYSPAILRGHRYLSGLYQKDRQYLYVNRGLGVIGFPGRIGMLPEITVITLRTK